MFSRQVFHIPFFLFVCLLVQHKWHYLGVVHNILGIMPGEILPPPPTTATPVVFNRPGLLLPDWGES